MPTHCSREGERCQSELIKIRLAAAWPGPILQALRSWLDSYTPWGDFRVDRETHGTHCQLSFLCLDSKIKGSEIRIQLQFAICVAQSSVMALLSPLPLLTYKNGGRLDYRGPPVINYIQAHGTPSSWPSNACQRVRMGHSLYLPSQL